MYILIRARTPGRSEKPIVPASPFHLDTGARSSEMTLVKVAATPKGSLPAINIWHSCSGRNCDKEHRADGNGARRAWKGAPGDGLVRSPLAGDHKIVEILIRYSNKLVHEYCCAPVYGGKYVMGARSIHPRRGRNDKCK